MPSPRVHYFVAVRDTHKGALQTMLDGDPNFGKGHTEHGFSNAFPVEYTDGTNSWWVTHGSMTKKQFSYLEDRAVNGATLPGLIAGGVLMMVSERVDPNALATWGLTPVPVEV